MHCTVSVSTHVQLVIKETQGVQVAMAEDQEEVMVEAQVAMVEVATDLLVAEVVGGVDLPLVEVLDTYCDLGRMDMAVPLGDQHLVAVDPLVEADLSDLVEDLPSVLVQVLEEQSGVNQHNFVHYNK